MCFALVYFGSTFTVKIIGKMLLNNKQQTHFSFQKWGHLIISEFTYSTQYTFYNLTLISKKRFVEQVNCISCIYLICLGWR